MRVAADTFTARGWSHPASFGPHGRGGRQGRASNTEGRVAFFLLTPSNVCTKHTDVVGVELKDSHLE